MKEGKMNEKEEYLFDSGNDKKQLKEKKHTSENQNSKKNILIGALAAIGVLGIMLLLTAGNAMNKKTLENKMKQSSKEFFEKYMSVNENSYEYIVTIDMLENANKQGEKYDLKGLEKCKKQITLSRISIDIKTGKVKKIEVELNC